MKFVIVTGGTPPSKQLLASHIKDADTLIGVDGAADVLCGYGELADVLIGDFDTATEQSVRIQQEKGAKVLRLASEKNETDTQAAVDYAIKNGASHIIMLGALGTRIDHTQSNIMLLLRAHAANVDAKIIDENNELLVCNDSITLSGTPGQTISILPLTGNVTVTATDLYYPLNNLLLEFGTSRGISNVMTSDTTQITVKGAYALIIIANADE
ncbi:MAG: thiamine diphosphokinase [Clostridia bacterium]|jgi:thiamine pyrophosphokinase|nr:thiamine diphosphokinase [Clostridia bacterium]MBT7121629.1 thiamine diphosphokinase [Clostridia bacterium]